ncbi:MAG: gpW family head-tail joining protein [Lentilitoribacter sp.]
MQIIVTETNRVEWQTRLEQAVQALHKLQIGKVATAIGYDGETISYAPANTQELKRYIESMQSALGIVQTSRPRARGFRF